MSEVIQQLTPHSDKSRNSLNATISSARTPLVEAILSGDLEQVLHLLSNNNCDVNGSVPEPLAIAIEELYASKPQKYLPLKQYQEMGPNPDGNERSKNIKISSKESVEDIMETCSPSSPAQELVSGDIDIQQADEKARAAVAVAIASQPNVNSRVNFPLTDIPVLFYAVQSGASELVSALISSGANVSESITSCFGHTPLSVAVSAPIPSLKIIQHLIKAGADTSVKFLNGTTILRAATFHKTFALDMLKLLLSPKFDLNNLTVPCDNGSTALHSAASLSHTDEVATAMAELLLTPQDSNKDKDENILVPRCDPEGAIVDSGCLPLHLAAMNGKERLCQLLIQAAPSTIDSLTSTGSTAVMLAAAAGHVNVLKLLIESKASLDRSGLANGMNAVHLAAYKGHMSCLQLLAGMESVDLNCRMRGIEGLTPVLLAAVGGHEHIIGLLGSKNVDSEQPLRLACNLGVAQVAWHLLMLRHESDGKNARKEELERAHGWRTTIVSQKTYFELFNNYRAENTECTADAENPENAEDNLENHENKRMQNCNQRTKNDLKSGKSSDTDEVLTTIDVVPETLLSIAVANGFVDVAATLIAFGEDVNEVVCADGPSPVLFAAQRMQWQCAQLLICANVNRDDVKKAVECAKFSGDASALEQLGTAVRIATIRSHNRNRKVGVPDSSETNNLFSFRFDDFLDLFAH